uniref:type IVB secretion system protein IcmH/DotU n=1 Tax=Pelomonas sp. KK5 TaxID=1855730 RepID=UPI00097C3200
MKDSNQERAALATREPALNVADGLGIGSAPVSALQFEPGPRYEERLAAVQAAQQRGANPIIEAATVLLRSLAEIPQRLDVTGLNGLHGLLVQELKVFTRLCEQCNLRRDHMLISRYALCTALDEAINLTPTAGGGADSTGHWSTLALLNALHGESHGGRKVFLIIGRLAQSVDEHLPVIELMHHLLSLGFMGDYRVQADGRRHLETIRHRLHVLVAQGRPPLPRELSEHWRGETEGRFRMLRSLPVWVSASLLGLALFGAFAWQKYQLLRQGAAVQADIQAIAKIPLAAAAPAPRTLTLAQLLADDIKAGRVAVTDGPGRSLVVFKGDGMFTGGLTRLAPATEAILTRVAEALNDVPGTVRIVGHTDNVPIQSAQFKDNQALSEARAAAVRAFL